MAAALIPWGAPDRAVVALEAAVEKRDHIDVFGTDYATPGGSCVRDYIRVSDLADAHVAAPKRLIERPSENLLLNCGYGPGLSVLEVLSSVERLVGTSCESSSRAEQAIRPHSSLQTNGS